MDYFIPKTSLKWQVYRLKTPKKGFSYQVDVLQEWSTYSIHTYFYKSSWEKSPYSRVQSSNMKLICLEKKVCSLYVITIGHILFFHQITTFIKVCMVLVFGLQTLWLLDFTKTYQLKGLKPKNNGCTNFYECCDLTEKVYLTSLYWDLYLWPKVCSSQILVSL